MQRQRHNNLGDYQLNFTSYILMAYGKQGKEWLQNLPKIVRRISAMYGLDNLAPVLNQNYHFLMSGFQGVRPIVLKLGLDIDGLSQEAEALKAFRKFGAVEIIALEKGMLLLEQAIPGTSLSPYFPKNDTESMEIASSVMKQLHLAPIPLKHTFPHIKDLLSCLDKDWEIEQHYLHQARQVRDRLLQMPTKEILLHGDLHHENILQNDGSWIVIDPKGVVGEPAYEAAAFICNPIPELFSLNTAKIIMSNRIIYFAEIFGVPSQKILDWCLLKAVLSWIWALEDDCDTRYFRQLTETIGDLSLN